MGRRVEQRKVPMSINIQADTMSALDAVAERNDLAKSLVARMAVETGLPIVRERLRKQRRQNDGK